MKKGCLIASIIALFILSVGIVYYFYKQIDKDPFKYELTQAAISNIDKNVIATGTIIPRQEVNIKPQVSGVIDQLYVEAGEIVKKGDNIARIKLVPSEVNINSARSNVELARIRLIEAKRELQRQKTINTRRLDVEQTKTSFDNASIELERQKSLYDEGVISEQEYNQYQLDAAIKEAQFENAKISATNTLSQFESTVDIRQQELNAAINNLQLLKEGATRNSLQVSNIVKSTLDGMVLDIPVKEGSSVIERNNFNEGTNIAIIANMSNLVFEGKVDEADIGKLKEGMSLEITVGAIENAIFDAILEFISPKGVDEQGTIKFLVRAAMKENKTEFFLRAGYSANANIILDRREEILTIYERDVVYENGKTFVEIATGNNTFEKKEVELGLSDGIIVEVLNGLDSTQEIKLRADPDAGS